MVTVEVGQGGFKFVPSTVNILAGDTVHWHWAGGGHNVHSGTPCTDNNQFCSLNNANCSTDHTTFGTGTTYDHTFGQAGTFSYFCTAHCSSFGMTGTVIVADFIKINSVTHAANGHVFISGEANPNVLLTVHATTSLTPNFDPLGSDTVATDPTTGAFNYEDTNVPADQTKYYRLTYP